MTEIVQLEFELKLAGQLFVWWKSPVIAMPEIKSAPAPRFVSLTDIGALVVPTFWAGNVSDPDEKFTLGLSTLSETDAPVWELKLLSPEYAGVMM